MKTFTQVTNQENDLNAIETSYQDRFGHAYWLADGLQKDAIQNCWDARVNSKGDDWKCIFSLMDWENYNKVLTITDSGTTGLIGSSFDDYRIMIELLKSSNAENLARFLNSNWSGKSSESGGKWGRGKNIFLISSEKKEFYFDSYRSDDKRYIFGKVYLDNDEKRIKFTLSWDNEAKAELIKYFSNIKPLNKFGTRIIIPHLRNQISDAIKENKFSEFIGNTRWEIIKKFDAEIVVSCGDNIQKIKCPSWYSEELELNTNRKIYEPEAIHSNGILKTKKLVLLYERTGDIPEEVRGIAIQRGGMTIERIPSRELLNIEQTDKIYGWIELDKNLEKGMYNLENVEHTGFSWTYNPAKTLKDYLRRKTREFAQEYNLLEDDRKKNKETRRIAEEKALKNLIPLFKKLDFSKNRHAGKGGHLTDKNKRLPDEPLRLSAIDFALPRHGDHRINYNEHINNAYVKPINETGQEIYVLVRTFIVSENGDFSKIIEERKFLLSPNANQKIGMDTYKISPELKRGKYYFRAKLVCLEDTNFELPDKTRIEKGFEYTRVNIPFFIEQDPPPLGNLPFRFEELSKKNPAYLFDWRPQEEGVYVIEYNGEHPKVQEIKKKDLQDGENENLTDFLTENAAIIAYQIKLEEVISGEGKIEKELQDIIKTKDLTKIMRYLLAGQSEFLWDYIGG